jgi:DNA-directed RNA polymerase specialized sigma24 family protein
MRETGNSRLRRQGEFRCGRQAAHAAREAFDHALAPTYDEFVGHIAPREREVLLMHEVHGVPLQEVAPALGIAPAEAEGLLASARRRVRAADKAAR